MDPNYKSYFSCLIIVQFFCNNTLSDKLSYDTALMTPLIMRHCSKLIVTIQEAKWQLLS